LWKRRSNRGECVSLINSLSFGEKARRPPTPPRAAVALDCAAERAALVAAARRIDAAGRLAVVRRARELGARSRAPREHLDRHRLVLHQTARELRAASARGLAERIQRQQRIGGVVLERKLDAARGQAEREFAVALPRRAATLERAARALAERQARVLRAHEDRAEWPRPAAHARARLRAGDRLGR